MNIILDVIKEVEFQEPLDWLDSNNYQNASLLTGDDKQSEFSLFGWNQVHQYSFSFDNKVWDKLNQLLQRYNFSTLPFPADRCGWIGYLSYDLGRYLERLPNTNQYSYHIPEARISLYKNYRYWDNSKKKCWEISFAFPDFSYSAVGQNKASYSLANFKQECDEAEYCRKVSKIQDYILNGIVYEVNLTQQFSADFTGSPWAFFKKLYQKNSGPFSAYLSYSDLTVCSISPEQFLSYQDRQVLTKPIKGTSPRGKNEEEDRANRLDLLNSEKDLAELHMIVDLLRNDLSKVCEIGSVSVVDSNKLETFSNVFHLVGIVEGYLQAGLTIVDLIKACFPGGSITGCPKIASMKVIEELESSKRNLYTGSIFVGNNNFLRSSIVIRTGIIVKDKVFVNSGGAITIDSDPASEYQEILHKIRNFLVLRED